MNGGIDGGIHISLYSNYGGIPYIVFALRCNILWASYMGKKDDIAFTKYFSFGVWGGPEKDLGHNL